MNDSKIMMSQELQGLIPDLEGDDFNYGTNSVVHFEIAGRDSPFHGPLVGFSFNDRLKVELRTTPEKALQFCRNKDVVIFDLIKIIYCNESLSFEGPFKIHRAKVHDVKQKDQVCTLRLSFVSVTKE